MRNPMLGFQHISNVSATFTECLSSNATDCEGLCSFYHHLIWKPKHFGKDGEPLGEGRAWRGSKGVNLFETNRLLLWERTTRLPWPGDTGPPEEACSSHKAITMGGNKVGTWRKSQRSSWFHKAQRLAVITQFLEGGEVRKKTTLWYRVSLRINLSGWGLQGRDNCGVLFYVFENLKTSLSDTWRCLQKRLSRGSGQAGRRERG